MGIRQYSLSQPTALDTYMYALPLMAVSLRPRLPPTGTSGTARATCSTCCWALRWRWTTGGAPLLCGVVIGPGRRRGMPLPTVWPHANTGHVRAPSVPYTQRVFPPHLLQGVAAGGYSRGAGADLAGASRHRCVLAPAGASWCLRWSAGSVPTTLWLAQLAGPLRCA